jgi:hypothetical protein
MAMAAAKLQWATMVVAQWTAGQQCNCDGNHHEWQWRQ